MQDKEGQIAGCFPAPAQGWELRGADRGKGEQA